MKYRGVTVSEFFLRCATKVREVDAGAIAEKAPDKAAIKGLIYQARLEAMQWHSGM